MPAATPPDARPPRDWELIYVSDPSNVTNYDFDPGDARPLITRHPAAPEELAAFIDHAAASDADAFVQEVYNAGWTMYSAPSASSTTRVRSTAGSCR